jgi:hypothetical protein
VSDPLLHGSLPPGLLTLSLLLHKVLVLVDVVVAPKVLVVLLFARRLLLEVMIGDVVEAAACVVLLKLLDRVRRLRRALPLVLILALLSEAHGA